MPLVAGLLLAAGCGRTMSEDDCRQVGAALGAAWEAGAKQAAAAAGGLTTGEAVAVLGSEGKKLPSEWMLDCKRELAGHRVDPKELACLTRAKTLAELSRCAGP